MEQNVQSNPFAALHKQKLYAVIIAGIGVISCLLPWWSFKSSFLGQSFGGSVNGMHDLGILVFLAYIAAGACCFLAGEKAKPFEGQFKLIAAGCFAGGALFTLIQFLRQSHFTAFGLWLSLLAGIAGAVLVYVLKPEQLK